MAVDDIVGLRIVGRYQSQNIVNTLHFKITGQTGDDHDVLGDLTTAWGVTNQSQWLGMHSANYELVGLRGFSLTGANKVPGITEVGSPGTVVGTEVPAGICRVVTLYTDSSNYRRRGRIMLSGSVAEDFEEDDGSVDPTVRGFMASLGTALIQSIASAGSVFQPGLAPHGVLPFEEFTDVQARKTPALIRSRRIRGFLIG